jgi:FtsZ-binding cell division protein ZapB
MSEGQTQQGLPTSEELLKSRLRAAEETIKVLQRDIGNLKAGLNSLREAVTNFVTKLASTEALPNGVVAEEYAKLASETAERLA